MTVGFHVVLNVTSPIFENLNIFSQCSFCASKSVCCVAGHACLPAVGGFGGWLGVGWWVMPDGWWWGVVGQEVGTRLGVSDNDFRRRRVQAQTHWLSLLLLLALLLVYIRSFVFSPSPIFLLFFLLLTPPARVLFASNLMRQKLCAKCGVLDGKGSDGCGCWVVDGEWWGANGGRWARVRGSSGRWAWAWHVAAGGSKGKAKAEASHWRAKGRRRTNTNTGKTRRHLKPTRPHTRNYSYSGAARQLKSSVVSSVFLIS